MTGSGEATASGTTANDRRTVERGPTQRERTGTPRPGGRTAEARSSAASGARRYRTQGATALAPEMLAPERTPPRTTGDTPRLRVAPPAPISAPRAPFIAVIILLVVAGVIGILLINTRTNENTFKLSRLQDQQAALDNQQQNLENQIAGYESTGNLDAAARRLGLVKAGTPAYIRLPDGRVIGVPKPGEGPTAVTAQTPSTAPSGAVATPPDGDAANGVTANGANRVTGGVTAGGVNTGGAQTSSVQNGGVQNGAVQNGTVPGGGTPQIAGQ